MTSNKGASRKNGWPPTKADKATITKILRLIRIDASVEEACSFARIHYNTFYNRYNSEKPILWEFEEDDPTDPDWKRKITVTELTTFRDLVEQARAYKFILAKRTLMKSVGNGNVQASIEFLKRRSPDYYDKQVAVNSQADLVQDIISDLKHAKTHKRKRAKWGSRSSN